MEWICRRQGLCGRVLCGDSDSCHSQLSLDVKGRWHSSRQRGGGLSSSIPPPHTHFTSLPQFLLLFLPSLPLVFITHPLTHTTYACKGGGPPQPATGSEASEALPGLFTLCALFPSGAQQVVNEISCSVFPCRVPGLPALKFRQQDSNVLEI